MNAPPIVDQLHSLPVAAGDPDHKPPSLRLLALLQRSELHDLALDRLRQGLCVFDGQQRLQLFNRRYAEMYDIEPSRLSIGMTLRDVVDLRCKAGTGLDMTPEQYAVWRERIGIAERVTDTEVKLSDGRVHAIHHEPIAGGGWVATFEDITERRRAEASVRHMAHHDTLTDLPNRALFAERLESALARSRGEDRLEDHRAALASEERLIAVLFLDLDNFKDTNDTLGHAAGDELLRLAAVRIGRCIRDGDTLARFGGDEFAVLLERLVESDQAHTTAQRMIGEMAAPFMLDGQEVTVGTSVGIALCDPSSEDSDPALLLRQADMALYRAKAEKRGTPCFFRAGMQTVLHRRKGLERDLRRALSEGGLDVYFQPMWLLAPRRLLGAEALARWQHPEHGVVAPAEFIPLAESAGLIGELGAWVMRAACARAVHWNGLCVAVNLSPEQVRRPGLVELVAEVLAETGLAPSLLELEITESLLFQDTATTLPTLGRLRGLGVGIVLDNFGSGYSSLSYLRRFPFSKLKLDRSFTADMADDAGTAIVQAVTALGRRLAMRVMVEGIETEEQLGLLLAMGCVEGQGYLLGRPGPAEDFEPIAKAAGA